MVNPYDAPRSALRIGEGLRWSASMKGCWYLGLLAPTLFEFLAMTLWLFPAGAHELLFGAGWGIADGVGWAAMCFASSRSVRTTSSHVVWLVINTASTAVTPLSGWLLTHLLIVLFDK